ncbi:MAG: LamG domain-containing protein [Spirochaetales bacterium]|nr:LamG domain-containing protein [Spirochaetales bacterium]
MKNFLSLFFIIHFFIYFTHCTLYNPFSGNEEVLADLNDTLVFYPFNGGPTDESGNDVHLSVNNASLALNRQNITDRAYRFEAGFVSYLENTTNPVTLDFSTELTISVWINLENSVDNQKIIGKVSIDDKYGFLLGVDSGGIYPEIWDIDSILYTFRTGTIPADTWVHLAITWKSGAKFRGYINSVPVAEIDASKKPLSNGDSPFRIGAPPWSTTTFLVTGSIDDIRIYDRELSNFEIKSLYNLPVD